MKFQLNKENTSRNFFDSSCINSVLRRKWRFFADILPSKATCNICCVPELLQRLKVNYLRLLVFCWLCGQRRLRCTANCFHFFGVTWPLACVRPILIPFTCTLKCPDTKKSKAKIVRKDFPFPKFSTV